MQTLNIVAKELFNKIRGRFPSVTIGDGEGNVTTTPEQARFYDFDFITEGRAVGKISISLDEKGVSVVYNQGLVTNEDSLTKESWYNFLKELRQFAKKRMLNFDTRDINKSNLNRRDYKFLANNRTEEETMSEGKLYGTSRLSYQDFDGARLVLRHNQAVNQERAAGRTQNVESIYIESAEGERFKYPYKHINGARAMARHVAEGGNAYDEFGKHIVGLSEELSKLKKFKSYMSRSNVMAEGLSGYVDVVKERLTTVKKTVESLQKKAYYTEAFESFEKTEVKEVPQDVAENWIDELTIRQFNEELKDVFPYIYNLVSEATKAKDITAEDILGEAPIDDVEVRAPAETYKVASGDTIYSIAKKFQNANFQGADIEEAVKEIMMLNNIADPKALQVGQVIEMPYFMGTGPDGSTRGMPGSFDKYGEEIENSFEDMMGQFAEAKEEMCPEACCGKPVTECKCGPDCEHCDCHEKNKMNEAKGKDHDDDGDIDSDDYMAAKDKAIKKAMGKDDDELEEQKIPVSEFVLSLFDREQGTFPKGETAVLTAIEKDYGEQYIEPAKQFIERIQSTFEQYANPVQEPMIDEEPTGTVMEPTIEQDEEIGESGKDKYSKAEKKTEAQEIRELGDRLMKLAGL